MMPQFDPYYNDGMRGIFPRKRGAAGIIGLGRQKISNTFTNTVKTSTSLSVSLVHLETASNFLHLKYLRLYIVLSVPCYLICLSSFH